MTAWRLIDRLIEHVSGILVFFGALAMLLMTLHVAVDVTGRYFFNNPLPGTLESVTYFYMVMVTALPFAYVTRGQGQICVEMFTSGLPPRGIRGVEVFAGLVTLAYVTAMTYKTAEEAINKTGIGETQMAGSTPIITWPSRWLLPIGFGFMALAVVGRIVKDINAIKSASAK